jgi:molecular chaperone DnaK (HSP70)
MGRRFSDPTLANDVKPLRFKVLNKNDRPCIEVKYQNRLQRFWPEEIAAIILNELKLIAQHSLRRPVNDCVIAVPPHFTDDARQAIIDAAGISSLKIRAIVFAPVAICQGLSNEREWKILVFDLEGETFDVSVIDNHSKLLGNCHLRDLGGEDFNDRLFVHLNSIYESKMETKLHNLTDFMRLREAAIQANDRLRKSNETSIRVEDLNGGTFVTSVLRSTFENLSVDLFERLMLVTKEVVRKAHLTAEQINRIVFMGAPICIPKIRQLLLDLFKNVGNETYYASEDDIVKAVAQHAAMLEIGETLEDIVVVSSNPITIGIETQGGLMTPLIPKDAKLPFSAIMEFTTSRESQTSIPIRIVEGERARVTDNHRILTFHLKGINPGPAGAARITVTFTLDEHDLLSISRQNQVSKATQMETFFLDGLRLCDGEIGQAIKRGEEMKQFDHEIRLATASKNRLENYLHRIKRRLRALSNKTPNQKKCVLLIEEWIDWVDSHDQEDNETYKRQFRKVWDDLNALVKDVSMDSEDEVGL